jgi:sugar-specific transcriptional regulator TrmB
MELGLTLNQARAYLALVLAGPVGAKEIAEASSISRQDVYRVMAVLEERGIAEKLLSTPTVFKALPIEDVMKNLLDRKIGEHRELQRRSRRLIVDVKSSQSEKSDVDYESQFTIIPCKEAIIQRISDALYKTSRSLEVVTSSERFSSAILAFSKSYEDALSRGVRIRIAAEKHVAQNGAFEVVKNLSRNEDFEVRFFPYAPEAVVSIFDSKEASVTLSSTANSSKGRALWSNDNGFVTLARHYFENMWSNAAGLSL